MDTSSAGAACPNQVSKKTVDRENCVHEDAHTAAGGVTSGTAFVCGLDDAGLASIALGVARLVIDPQPGVSTIRG